MSDRLGRNDDPAHIAASRPPNSGMPRPHGNGPMQPVMGDGSPCMSCGGNDGYGPAPHHTPDCYFASTEDADRA